MNNFIKRLIRVLLAATGFLLGFLTSAFGLLASGSQTTRDDDELGSSMRGGDLKFPNRKV